MVCKQILQHKYFDPVPSRAWFFVCCLSWMIVLHDIKWTLLWGCEIRSETYPVRDTVNWLIEFWSAVTESLLSHKLDRNLLLLGGPLSNSVLLKVKIYWVLVELQILQLCVCIHMYV